MADPSPIDRIERALARIEHAALARIDDSERLARRHEALRTQVGAALTALDALIEAQDAE